MSRWNCFAVLGVAVVIAFVGATWAAKRAKFESNTEPRLEIPDNELHLGDQYETNSFKTSLSLINPSDGPLTIVNLRSNCDCVELLPQTPFTIPGGGVAQVSAKFALRFESECQRSNGAGSRVQIPLWATISAKSERERPLEQHWNVDCNLRALMIVRDEQADLDTVRSLKQPIKRRFSITCPAAVDRIEATAHPNWGLNSRQEYVSGGSRYSLEFDWRGPREPVSVSDEIVVHALDGTGSRMLGTKFVVRAELVEDVVAFPREVLLGLHPVGTSLEDTFRLRSISGRALKRVEIKQHSDVEAVLLRTIEDEATIRVRTRVGRQGEVLSHLHVEVVDDQGDFSTLRVPLKYEGQASNAERKSK